MSLFIRETFVFGGDDGKLPMWQSILTVWTGYVGFCDNSHQGFGAEMVMHFLAADESLDNVSVPWIYFPLINLNV